MYYKFNSPQFVTGPRVFSWGDGGPPIRWKFCQSPPPSDTCPHLWTKACPPPAEVCPRKFENFKSILCQIWLLLSSFYLKKLYFMLKIAKKWPNFALGGLFWLQSDFFRKSTPSDFVPVGDRRGPKILSPPNKKFREKTLGPNLLFKFISHIRDWKKPTFSKTIWSLGLKILWTYINFWGH